MPKQLLSDAVDDWLAFRRAEGKARNTLEHNRGTMKSFLASTGNIYTSSITERHVTTWLTVRARTRGAGAVAIDVVNLRTFCRWCRSTRRMQTDNDPLAGRGAPKIVRRERVRLHVSKFPAFLDAAQRRCDRDRAVVALALYTLMRGSEIANLRIGDVDLAAGYLRARVSKSHLEDRVPICAELDTELRRWLTAYATAVDVPLTADSWLVPARTRTVRQGTDGRLHECASRLTPDRRIQGLWRIVKPLLADFGIELYDRDGKSSNEGMHTLRRSGARAWYDSLVTGGHDYAMRTVQAMLHHRSVTTTEIYLGVDADRKTRDDLLRGQTMYGTPADNVVKLADAR